MSMLSQFSGSAPRVKSTRMKWAWGFGITGFVLTLTIFGVIFAAPLFVIAGVLGLQDRIMQKRNALNAYNGQEQRRAEDRLSQQRVESKSVSTTPNTDTPIVDAEWVTTPLL